MKGLKPKSPDTICMRYFQSERTSTSWCALYWRSEEVIVKRYFEQSTNRQQISLFSVFHNKAMLFFVRWILESYMLEELDYERGVAPGKIWDLIHPCEASEIWEEIGIWKGFKIVKETFLECTPWRLQFDCENPYKGRCSRSSCVWELKDTHNLGFVEVETVCQSCVLTWMCMESINPRVKSDKR